MWQLNAKVERFFRTFKTWQRRAWMAPSQRSIQRRLDAFREWYNEYRPHAAHVAQFPEESLRGHRPQSPVRYTQKGGVTPEIRVIRQATCGDPSLWQVRIECTADSQAA